MEVRNTSSEIRSSNSLTTPPQQQQAKLFGESTICSSTLVNHHKPNTPSPSPSPTPSPREAVMIRYRECQRNHAAHLGGHVVDGCGEFMPAGEDGTPQSLKCAACDCHRNFHRRETEPSSSAAAPPPLLLPPPPSTAATNCYISFSNNVQKGTPVRPVAQHPRAPVMMAFGGGGGGGAAAESSSEDLNTAAVLAAAEQYGASSRKRFRTKFTADQKEKMTVFAERIGWRIQKQDDAEVHRFCAEVGVRRQVFKVWLHNNKQALKRKPSE